MGLVEHPFKLSRFRLLCESAFTTEVVAFDPDAPLTEVWTDGSVMWPHSFWLTTAAYAVIGSDATILSVGRVKRWNLSSYVAELWAIWMALKLVSAPLHIYCDNNAVVCNIGTLLSTGRIEAHWKCQDWWRAIQTVVQQRSALHRQPLQTTWIPAHLCEDVPDNMLDERVVASLGSSVRHVMLNRRADAVAKACALRIAPIVPDMVQPMLAASTLHQDWLVRLHCQLTTNDVSTSQETDRTTTSELTLLAAKKTFPSDGLHLESQNTQ